MKDINEMRDRMIELVEAVDTRTGVPKFPALATEVVREISEFSQTTKFYTEFAKDFRDFWKDGTRPEEIWMFMLQKVVHAPTRAHMDMSIIGHMPALEKALDAQRRCRVCGCTDDNACPGGCYWMEDDLCSECAKTAGAQE